MRDSRRDRYSSRGELYVEIGVPKSTRSRRERRSTRRVLSEMILRGAKRTRAARTSANKVVRGANYSNEARTVA